MVKSPSAGGNDERKTKAQLIAELAGVRRRVSQVEVAEIDRQRAEAALRESEERFSRLAAVTVEGIIISEQDKIIDANDQCARLLGYEPGELIGQRVIEMVAPESRDLVMANVRVGAPGPYEHLALKKDGSRLPVEIRARAISYKGRTARVTVIRDMSERKQAEDKLRYQAFLLEGVNDAIVVSDAEARLSAWNAAAERLYGWMAEEVLGRKTLEVLQTEWAGADAKEMQSAIEERQRWRAEVTQARKDGSRIPVEMSSRVQRDATGQIMGYISVNRDITERKRAEEALKERLKELDCLYGISALMQLQGLTLDEIMKRAVMLFPPAWQFPEITEACIVLEEQTSQTARFRETPWMQAHEISVNGHPAGQVTVCYLEERPASDEGPFMIEERHLINAIAEQLGLITERTRAEKSLAQLAAIVESSDEAIIGKTLDGEVVSWNVGAEGLYGYAAAEMIGRSISILMPPEQTDDLSQILEQIKRGKPVRRYDTIRRMKDGRIVNVSLAVSPVKNAAGQVTGASTIAHDITARKQLEDEIRQLNVTLEQRVADRTRELAAAIEQLAAANTRLTELDRLKDLFISRISHELRTPLANIQIYLKLLDQGKPEKWPQYHQTLRHETDRLHLLIEDLLSITQFDQDLGPDVAGSAR